MHGILFVIKYEHFWHHEIHSVPGGESDSVKHKGSQPLLVQDRAAQ